MNTTTMNITLGELELFEDISGQSFQDMGNGDVSAKAMLALTYIAMRRKLPDVTLDDVRAMGLDECTEAMDALVPSTSPE